MDIEPLNFDLMTNDIWEVMAVCHGPEDPPGALIKASAAFHCPILALLSTCYEVIYNFTVIGLKCLLFVIFN